MRIIGQKHMRNHWPLDPSSTPLFRTLSNISQVPGLFVLPGRLAEKARLRVAEQGTRAARQTGGEAFKEEDGTRRNERARGLEKGRSVVRQLLALGPICGVRPLS